MGRCHDDVRKGDLKIALTEPYNYTQLYMDTNTMKPMRDFAIWLKNPLNLLVTILSLLPMYMVALYMHTYGRNVPVNDHWLFGIKIAQATAEGRLSLDIVLQDFAGHRIFFTGMLHAIMTRFTHWNTIYEMWVNLPLAVGEFLVLIAIVRKQYPQLTALVLIPFSLLTFSVYQYLNWVNGFYSIWHFVPLFFLLTILAVQRLPIGWRAVGLAAFLSLCATFSLGPGVVVWAAIGLGMVFFGYRKPEHFKYYAVFGLALLATLYVYTREVQVSVSGEGGGFSSIRLAPVDEMLTFFLTFVGNPFTAEYQHTIALRIAIIGIIVFSLNIAFLWWKERRLESLAPWITMMLFAFGVAALITLTRYTDHRWITALEQRYTVISTQFWLAWIATAAIVIWYQGRGEGHPRWGLALVGCNVLLALVIGSAYLRANLWNWQAMAQRYSVKIGLPYEQPNEEDCILQYPLTRDGTCVWETFVVQLGNATPEQIYLVAALDLTIFADQTPANVLPDSYQTGDPVVIESPSRWLNVYIRDWMLEGLPDDAMLHIAPPVETLSTETLPRPLGDQVLTEADYSPDGELAAFIGESEQVWYISTPETESQAQAFDAYMTEQGYVPLFIPIRIAPYSQGHFTLTRYRQAPQNTQALFTFGDDITLQAWEVVGGEAFAPCDVLTVQTWWQVEQTPARNYSATLRLLNGAGEKVANTDGAPGGIDFGVWEAELLYADDRSLTIPCDLPAGEYTLAVGLYDAETLESLPVQDSEEELATLTTIIIQ